jgi:hypothetical protein
VNAVRAAPALLLTGTASTAAARAVARLVAQTLPRVQVEELVGANPLIERFLSQVSQA